MGRKLFGTILTCVLSLCMGTAVYAQTSYGSPDWQVTFTNESKMESNFEKKDIDDVISGMQPGDRVIITLALTNQHSATTDWYMTNKVLSSLEDSANVASGGAYTYILAYTGPDGQKNTLFSSDTVGGSTVSTAGEGLHEATNALDDYFYLDTLASGQSGKIVLEVALDGETQGDDYQDTLADLQMNFAVELNSSDSSNPPGITPSTSGRSTVKTGDDTNIMPYLIACGISGLLLLALGCYSIRQQQKERRKAAR